jgi:lycopene cyclase domain-containing protein
VTTVPEYTAAATAAAVAVIALELVVLRGGLFRRPTYWVAIGIVFAFQVPVDGWLTKLSAPVVVYGPDHNSGLRVPWDIPVEDFLYGFALVTLTLALWVRAGGGSASPASRSPQRTSARRAPGPDR